MTWPLLKILFCAILWVIDCNLARVNADGQPSLTALTAAAARAAHLIVDEEPRIFADTLAEAMLGERAEELIAYHRAHGTHAILAGARRWPGRWERLEWREINRLRPQRLPTAGGDGRRCGWTGEAPRRSRGLGPRSVRPNDLETGYRARAVRARYLGSRVSASPGGRAGGACRRYPPLPR
jgi:hypothetical protein